MRFLSLWIRDILRRHAATALLLGATLVGGSALVVLAAVSTPPGTAPHTGATFSLQAVPSVSLPQSSPASSAASSAASVSVSSRPPAHPSSSSSLPGPPPATVPLQRFNVQQPRTADGILRSGARMAADTNLSYLVHVIDVAVGDSVTAGQRLCQLDTAELDSDIAELREAIARAQADDALKLEQARQKLADAEAKLAADEPRLAALVQSALQALETARQKEATAIADQWLQEDAQVVAGLVEATEAAFNTYEDEKARIAQKYQNAEDAGHIIPQDEQDADRMLLDGLWEAAGIAQGKWDTAANVYREKWESKYSEAYALARPSPEQQNYERTLDNQTTTLQKDKDDIAQAQSGVETCRAANSAAAKQAELEKLLRRLEQTAIYAPIGGIVTEVNAQVGLLPSATRSGSSLFVIQDTSQLVVEISVPGSDIVRYTLGHSATVTVPALATQSWAGAVSAISPAAGRDGNFTVTVSFVTPPLGLRAGTQVQLHFADSTAREVLAAPESAVLRRANGQAVVYLYTPPERQGQRGSVREVNVQTAPAGGGLLEITGGTLKEGDLLVANAAEYTASPIS